MSECKHTNKQEPHLCPLIKEFYTEEELKDVDLLCTCCCECEGNCALEV